MATTITNLAQAQAAYDTVDQQLKKIQRNDYIREQQAVMGVNNYLRQNGYTGGAAESILLRARGNRTDISSYNAQLAELAALINSLKNRRRSSAPAPEPEPVVIRRTAGGMEAVRGSSGDNISDRGSGSGSPRRWNTRTVM